MNDIIRELPKDIVCDAIRAQYADCEATRYRVLALGWEVERLDRWKDFYSGSVKYLKQRHEASRQTLDFWRSWCKAEAVDVNQKEQHAAQNSLENESATLHHLQDHFWSSEKTATSIHSINSEDIRNVPITHSSDTEDSDTSSFNISGTERGTSHTSNEENTGMGSPDMVDCGVSYASDPEVPYASDPEEDIFSADDNPEVSCAITQGMI